MWLFDFGTEGDVSFCAPVPTVGRHLTMPGSNDALRKPYSNPTHKMDVCLETS
jgi:hypothetical protein